MKPNEPDYPISVFFPEQTPEMQLSPEDEEDSLCHEAFRTAEEWDDREYCRNTTTWD